jgi:hypothetical protein
MKISTKTVASLLLVTAVAAAVPGVSEKIPGRKRFRHGSQFDRLLQRHDRKGELRAEVLGMDVRTFREKQKHKSLEEIAKQRGFRTVREFRIALLGKLKNELRQRGWSIKKIEQFVLKRSTRVS